MYRWKFCLFALVHYQFYQPRSQRELDQSTNWSLKLFDRLMDQPISEPINEIGFIHLFKWSLWRHSGWLSTAEESQLPFRLEDSVLIQLSFIINGVLIKVSGIIDSSSSFMFLPELCLQDSIFIQLTWKGLFTIALFYSNTIVAW